MSFWVSNKITVVNVSFLLLHLT